MHGIRKILYCYVRLETDAAVCCFAAFRNMGNQVGNFCLRDEVLDLESAGIRMIQVDEIKVDPHFAEDLFDIRHLKTIYPRQATVLPDQTESNELGEVQKALEEFKKIVE